MRPQNDNSIVKLNLDGWDGPLLLLKAKSLLDQLQPGQLVHIALRDGVMHNDLKMFLKACGHQLLEVVRSQNGTSLMIRRCD